MKTYTRNLLIFLSSCLTISCSRPVEPDLVPSGTYSADYWGTVSGLRDGKALKNPRIWAATRTPCNAYAFDIVITEFDDKGEKLFMYTMVNIPQRPGTLSQFRADYKNLFCATDTVGSTLTAWTSAGFAGTYNPYVGGSSITITNFDSVRKEIKGTFNLKMKADHIQSGSGPEVIKIERGVFHTKLKGPGGKYQ